MLISNSSACRCGLLASQKSLDFHESPNIAHHHPLPPGAHSHQSSISATNSQNSQNADEPPLKLRITNPITTAPTAAAADINHIEIEPKIDYDAVAEVADADDSQSANRSFAEQEQEQQQQQDIHFERMQHEYFVQQQQQQQQHQQQMEALMQDTSANSLRQRKERMSKKQKEVYVNFLEQHPLINEHRRNDPALDRYWLKLADILNSVPQGAVKHVAEWKQTFDNWRYRVFLYARYNSKISGDEALNFKSFKPLTSTDKRAYSIWIRNPDTAPPDLDKMRNVFVNLEETLQECP